MNAEKSSMPTMNKGLAKPFSFTVSFLMSSVYVFFFFPQRKPYMCGMNLNGALKEFLCLRKSYQPAKQLTFG